MEYCCHVWAGASSCFLELLDKLLKPICRTVGTSLAASFEPLAHCWNLSLFCRYYFGRCSSELAELVPFPYSGGRSTPYSDRLHDFSVTIPRCYKHDYGNGFFRIFSFDLWSKWLLILVFLNRFPVCFNLFALLFLVTPCLVVAVQSCMQWIPILKRTFQKPNIC